MEHKEYFSTYRYSLNSSISSTTIADDKLIHHLRTTISLINVYLGILILIFGLVGNILNVLILSQRPLRSNTCVMIFLAASITGTITILSGLSSRILSKWNADLSNTIRWICKFQGFILYIFRSVTFWLITLATIDRWVVSSSDSRFRQLSSRKNVLRCIIILIISSMIIHCQILYCYEPNLSNGPIKCFGKNLQCRMANDIIFAIMTILLPLILIAIFGIMTILKIRSNRSRVAPVPTLSIINHSSKRTDQRQEGRPQIKKTDRHLLIMLFIQVILLGFLTLPLAIQRLYATLTINAIKSTLHRTIDSFTYQITLLMSYIATGMQFYVNTLSGGTVFRTAIMNLKQLIIHKITCR